MPLSNKFSLKSQSLFDCDHASPDSHGEVVVSVLATPSSGQITPLLRSASPMSSGCDPEPLLKALEHDELHRMSLRLQAMQKQLDRQQVCSELFHHTIKENQRVQAEMASALKEVQQNFIEWNCKQVELMAALDKLSEERKQSHVQYLTYGDPKTIPFADVLATKKHSLTRSMNNFNTQINQSGQTARWPDSQEHPVETRPPPNDHIISLAEAFLRRK